VSSPEGVEKMEPFILGAIAITLFAIIAILVMLGKLPILIGMPIMAFLIPLACGSPLDTVINDVIGKGAVSKAKIVIWMICGSWLGQTMYKTGIIEKMIKKAVELGGDRPIPVLIAMYLVVSLIFTSIYSTGMVIAIGLIVLPIMLALGLSKWSAAYLYISSFMTGLSVNYLWYAAAESITGVKMAEISLIAIALAVLTFTMALAYIAINLKRGTFYERGLAWATEANTEAREKRGVPLYALLTPVIPPLVYWLLKWDIVVCLIIGVVYAIVTTSRRVKEMPDLAQKALIDAFPDAAVVSAIWITASMVIAMSGLPEVKTAFGAILDPILPHSKLGYIVFFILMAPLGLYRGPTNLIGLGAVFWPVLLSTGISPQALLALWWPSRYLGQLSCPTVSWNTWTLGYLKLPGGEYPLKVLMYTWPLVTIVILLASIIYL